MLVSATLFVPVRLSWAAAFGVSAMRRVIRWPFPYFYRMIMLVQDGRRIRLANQTPSDDEYIEVVW